MTFNEQNHDELYHRSHRYLKKIGNRYFYTTEELKAFYDKAKGGKNELKPNQMQLDKRTTGTFGPVSTNGKAKAPDYEHPTGYKLRKKIDTKVDKAKNELNARLSNRDKKPKSRIQVTHETTLGPGYAVDRNGNKKQMPTDYSGERYTKVDATRAIASKKAEAERQKQLQQKREAERKQKLGTTKARGTFVGGPTTDSAYKVNRIEESKKKGAAYDNKVSSAKKKTSDFIKTQREIGNEEAKDAIFKKEKRKKR